MRLGLRILKPETVKCLAFESVTARRVLSLDRYARDEPESPAAEAPKDRDREVIDIVVRGERLLLPAERDRPFPPDIRSWVVLLARIAGWQPSIGCPLPRHEVLWWTYLQLQTMLRVTRAARVRQPYRNLRLC